MDCFATLAMTEVVEIPLLPYLLSLRENLKNFCGVHCAKLRTRFELQTYNFAFKEILTLRHCEIPLVESWRALRKASHPL